MAWPENWDDLLSGVGCPICAEGRPETTEQGVRVFEGRHIDAYVGRRGAQRGYVVAIWRGRHVTDLGDLTSEELAGFWAEVATVSRAMERHYRPRKLNYEVLGNQMPHLHAHLTARFAEGDVAPGGPLPSDRDRLLDPDAVESDALALRGLLDAGLRRSNPTARTEEEGGP